MLAISLNTGIPNPNPRWERGIVQYKYLNDISYTDKN
jgi:hypothetical protein